MTTTAQKRLKKLQTTRKAKAKTEVRRNEALQDANESIAGEPYRHSEHTCARTVMDVNGQVIFRKSHSNGFFAFDLRPRFHSSRRRAHFSANRFHPGCSGATTRCCRDAPL